MAQKKYLDLNGLEYYTEQIKDAIGEATSVDSALSGSSENPVQNKIIKNALDNKVDKVNGKGLSTNDYTTDEKNKLAGIAASAEVNQNAFSNVKVGSTTIAADSKTDTLTLTAGDNITLTPDATNDKVTIAATDTNTTYSLTADTTNNKITLTPSSGTAQSITVPYATNAGAATNDGSGNAIANTYIKKAGDTMTGALTAPQIKTGTDAANYFQSQKFRGEGNASTYYHAVDFGYSGHNQVDFYEYGGVYNFHKHTGSAIDSGDTLLGKITVNGWEGNVVGDVNGLATKATGDKNGNDITTTYYLASNPNGYTSNTGTVTSITLNATSPISIDSSSAITTSGTRTLSHATSGVTAGTYRSVTVNATGHVTAGTNPTTLSGYGITDAKIASGVITLGSNTITPLTSTQLTNQNLNDITTPGLYYAGGGNTTTNKPSNVDAYGLKVFKTANAYITQELIEGNTTPGKRWTRQISSSWSSWTEMKMTDTKNTAGSTDTSSKIFLIGATSQAANPQTYSDNEIYATSGVLTTKSVQVGGTAATIQYNSIDKCIEFIFA